MKKLTYPLAALLLSVCSFAQQRIEITHFDIGQGDATLIVSRISSDSIITVLFDAGGYSRLSKEDAGAIINDVLISDGIRRIDYLVVSHYDADHIGGIIAGGRGNIYQTSFRTGRDNTPGTSDDITVINAIDRGDNRPPSSTIFRKYQEFANTINRVSLDSKSDRGYEISLGPEAKMTCLATNGWVQGRDAQVAYVNTENEKSLSFLLQYKKFDYLISGDMIGQKYGNENAKVEAAVGDYIQRRNINVDVFHADHHGAENGQEASFLADIQAEVGIISCGEGNSHHHPTLGALSRMVDSGMEMIFQTNLGSTSDAIPDYIKDRQQVFDGHIVITTDGESYDIYKYGYASSSGSYFQYSCDE